MDDLQKRIEDLATQRWGALAGTIIVVALFAIVWIVRGIVAVWWDWDKLKDRVKVLPFVSRFFPEPTPSPLPRAKPHKFSIGVAHLENDDGHRSEDLILGNLDEDRRKAYGIEVLKFDRTIAPQGSNLDELSRAGHEEARGFLEESGADALIWGKVQSSNDKSCPQLFWTTRLDLSFAKQTERVYPIEDFKLPGLFWDDLTHIIYILILTTRKGFQVRSTLGEDRFVDVISHAEQLLTTYSAGWDAETRRTLQLALADLLLVYSLRFNKAEAEEKAQRLYTNVIDAGKKKYDGHMDPRDVLHHVLFNLAFTHYLIGLRKSAKEQLKKAADMFRDLEKIHRNLGDDTGLVNLRLGDTLWHCELLVGGQNLREAVEAYENAWMSSFKYGQDDERRIMYTLGELHRILGERESDCVQLDQAQKAYNRWLNIQGSQQAGNYQHVVEKRDQVIKDKNRLMTETPLKDQKSIK